MSKEDFDKENDEYLRDKELLKEYGKDLLEDISDEDMDNEEADYDEDV